MGYKALYALAEFDADFTDGVILVADRKNGEALGAQGGATADGRALGKAPGAMGPRVDSAPSGAGPVAREGRRV